jgi:predicted HicB family RNase H-like nuclease
MARMGRPKLLAKERQSNLVALRLTPAEHKKLERLAEKSDLSVSAYVRRALGFEPK